MNWPVAFLTHRTKNKIDTFVHVTYSAQKQIHTTQIHGCLMSLLSVENKLPLHSNTSLSDVYVKPEKQKSIQILGLPRQFS